MKNFNIKVYTEFTSELENTWRNFEKESDNYFFQSLDWQKFWFQQMTKYKKKIFHLILLLLKKIMIFYLFYQCVLINF